VAARSGKTSAAIGILAWLVFVAGVYAYILFGTRERGSGMVGSIWTILGVGGGAMALLFTMIALSPLREGRRGRLVAICLTVALSFFGLIAVVRYGGQLYRLDQEEAKKFVERRIAEFRSRGSDATVPASQDEFVNQRPLPRILRGQRFYFRDGEREFHIEIRVDFDGGWNYSTARPVWMRST
jgi:hypothetical protein